MEITLRPVPPYNFRLNIDLLRGLGDIVDAYVEETYRRVLFVERKPTLISVRQVGATDNPLLEVLADREDISKEALVELLDWQFNTEADIRPFYEMARADPTLGPIIERLYGLKPLRPPTVFEMVVIAITEQQISLKAAIQIRNRLIRLLGDRVVYEGDDYYGFPTPKSLGKAGVEEIRECGLSRTKARYIIDVANQALSGDLDLESLKEKSNEEVIEVITAVRGLGLWTAEYVLDRGLGRFDAVPADDLGLRELVGKYLGQGERVTSDEVRTLLEPWGAQKGWVTFYLIAAEWLRLRA